MDSTARTADTTGYGPGHQPSVLASHGARTASNSCAYFLDRVDPGDRILDVGCGPGSITLDLAEHVGPEGQVVGVDFSPEAIDFARASAEQRGDATTQFLVADLASLEVEPESFDIVHAHQVLQHLTDPVSALTMMATYCKRGGIIAVRDADYGAMAWYPQLNGVGAWHETYCAIARDLGGEPDAGRRLRAWVQAAGLEIDIVGSSTWTYATSETTRWWGQTQARRVLDSSFTTRATERGLSSQQLEVIAEGWREWGDHPDAWFFLPHGEVIAHKGA